MIHKQFFIFCVPLSYMSVAQLLSINPKIWCDLNVHNLNVGGSLDVSGSINFGHVTADSASFTDTSNQLTFGTTNTTTLNSVAPSSSRIYTIPDAGSDCSFILSAGAQTIGGSKTFSSAVSAPSENLTNTSDQLVLGSSNTTTISSVAPSSPKIYSIPDVGANADFILSQGTQNISGSKIFSSTLSAPSVILTNTSNQLVLGSGNTVTLSSSIPPASRVYSIPNVLNSDFVMTDGNQSLFVTKTFVNQVFAPGLSLTSTSNQLVLGSGNTVTVSSSIPSAPRAYGIPDAGANANFILSQGSQTLSGNTTFSATVNLSGLTASSLLLLDSSKNISSSVLTNGQLLIGSTGNVPTAASITGTSNQITVTPGAGSITLSTPQNIATSSNVQFNSIKTAGCYGSYSNAAFGSGGSVTALTFATTDYSNAGPGVYTYSRDTVNGDTWTITASGIYMLTSNTQIVPVAGGHVFYITRNAATTTTYNTITGPMVLAFNTNTNSHDNICFCGYLSSGDVLRVQGTGFTALPSTIANATQNNFFITFVSYN